MNNSPGAVLDCVRAIPLVKVSTVHYLRDNFFQHISRLASGNLPLDLTVQHEIQGGGSANVETLLIRPPVFMMKTGGLVEEKPKS